jgi:NDP-sugar pyrophosphorylase family protein
VNDITLLERSVMHLKKHGINSLIINVHHFAGQIIDFLSANDNFGLEIAISDESDLLLDTGGALKKAAWFFHDEEPFLVRNVDVISDLDISALENVHRKSGALATLVVRERETSRYLLFNKEMQLSGWENVKTQEARITRPDNGNLSRLAFSGIQVLNLGIFPLITESGRFSLIELYLRLSSDHTIMAFADKESTWQDAGKFEDLKM